jgi:hypothetical protein
MQSVCGIVVAALLYLFVLPPLFPLLSALSDPSKVA